MSDRLDDPARPAAERPAGAPPRRRASLPPLAWLAAPVVVGLLAAGGLLWDRHLHRPAAWCGRIAPVLEAVEDLDGGPEETGALPALASAVDDLDLDALVAELPADLAPGIGERAALWPDLALQAASAAPGTPFLQVVPFPLVADVAALNARYQQECIPL